VTSINRPEGMVVPFSRELENDDGIEILLFTLCNSDIYYEPCLCRVGICCLYQMPNAED
jgi:hypothetical protein